ncbi:lipoprotein [Bdellovibrio sp. HCB2-146]|uniref:LptM family lipoprotein n=1 Tax=Bdellovibrio sp. HCB2-146 TaxID=3394362 RepID=UPI0039BCFB33
MKKFIATLLTVASVFWLAACGSDSGSSNNVGVYPNCQNGQCVYPGGTIVNQNSRWGVTNCSYPTYGCDNAPGYFQVSDVAAYQDFLEKGLGVCTFKYSTGWSDCKNWWPGKFEFAIIANLNVAANQYCSTKGLTVPSTMTVYAKAAYVANSAWQYGGSLGLGWPYNNGATFSGSTVNVINDCKGFEVRQNYGRYMLQIIIKEGNLSQNQLQYQLAWGSNSINPARVFATGTIYKY